MPFPVFRGHGFVERSIKVNSGFLTGPSALFGMTRVDLGLVSRNVRAGSKAKIKIKNQVKVKIRNKVNGSGQECPLHTGIAGSGRDSRGRLSHMDWGADEVSGVPTARGSLYPLLTRQ